LTRCATSPFIRPARPSRGSTIRRGRSRSVAETRSRCRWRRAECAGRTDGNPVERNLRYARDRRAAQV
jgi:hypothetical protein